MSLVRPVALLGLVSVVACAHHQGNELRFNEGHWLGPDALQAEAAFVAVQRATTALESDDADAAKVELTRAASSLKRLHAEDRRRVLAEGGRGERLRSALGAYLERTQRSESCAQPPGGAPAAHGHELGMDDAAISSDAAEAFEAPSPANCYGRTHAVMFNPIFGGDPRHRERAARSQSDDAEARTRACDRQVDELVAAGKTREAKSLARRERCSPEAVRRIDEVSAAALARDREACRPLVERQLAEGRIAEAYGHVMANPGRCPPELVERVKRENGVQRCETALANVEAQDANDLGSSALSELRAFGKHCPEKLQKAEAIMAARLRESVAKDPCALSRSDDAAVRTACREHLAEAMRTRRWTVALADLDRIPGTKEDVLPALVAALRATPPKAPVAGLPALRLAELALEAHTLRASTPWAAALAGTLARNGGYPWPVPAPAFDYTQANRVRTESVGSIFTMFTEPGPGVPPPAWRLKGEVTTVQEVVHVDADAFTTYKEFAAGGVTYGVTGTQRIAAHDRATGKSHAVVSAVTFIGGSGYPTVTVPLSKEKQKRIKRNRYSSEPGDLQEDLVRAAALDAWPSVRERWLEARARTSLQAMRRAVTDEARLEAAIQALAAGSQDPVARATIEKRFGTLPSGQAAPF